MCAKSLVTSLWSYGEGVEPLRGGHSGKKLGYWQPHLKEALEPWLLPHLFASWPPWGEQLCSTTQFPAMMCCLATGPKAVGQLWTDTSEMVSRRKHALLLVWCSHVFYHSNRKPSNIGPPGWLTEWLDNVMEYLSFLHDFIPSFSVHQLHPHGHRATAIHVLSISSSIS
jgi:hypothetical protein